MDGRAAAAAAREDKIAAAAQAAANAEAEADWRPQRDPALGLRPAPRVGKLFSMCLALLVEYIDDVETLYGLPTPIKVLSAFFSWPRLLCSMEHRSCHQGSLVYERFSWCMLHA